MNKATAKATKRKKDNSLSPAVQARLSGRRVAAARISDGYPCTEEEALALVRGCDFMHLEEAEAMLATLRNLGRQQSVER
jgi:hypothetical protein